jgi:cytochrome c oxidase subunit 2
VTPWGLQSSLAPAGPQAGRIAGLWWLFLGVSAVVYLAVMVAMIVAITRSQRPEDRARRTRVVSAAVALTVLILLGLLTRSVVAGKALTRLAGHAPVTIHLVGRQWWWEVTYEFDPPSQMVTTANEIHIPVGQPVMLKLESRDVIHSFWVPSLHGKRDLIPGHPSTTYIQADRPGVYRGQCAEFCGVQHAHMGLLVIAEPEAAYQDWLQRSRKPAPPPTSDLARRGQEVFLRGPCALCHAVAGTVAFGSNGPDLSHLASRFTIAAGTLPNQRGYRGGWILDAQSLKPGCNMPSLGLPGPDVQALLAYLETLQ